MSDGYTPASLTRLRRMSRMKARVRGQILAQQMNERDAQRHDQAVRVQLATIAAQALRNADAMAALAAKIRRRPWWKFWGGA